MSKNPLRGLTIRDAVVRAPSLGNILACDLKREEEDDPHAFVIKWQEGVFTRTEVNYDAHTICAVNRPELALVFLAADGTYGVHFKGGATGGDIFEDSEPIPNTRRITGIRSVSTVAQKAHAVGYRGMVYRLDRRQMWTRIDEGLPVTFNIESIDGFSDKNLFAVGNKGQVWEFLNGRWLKHDVPTDAPLNTVSCGGDGQVYAAGNNGVVIRGGHDRWEVVRHDLEISTIWGTQWFRDTVYLSTMDGLYQIIGGTVKEVPFGRDKPNTFYRLSATADVLWSIGEYDIVSFDGIVWSRIV